MGRLLAILAAVLLCAGCGSSSAMDAGDDPPYRPDETAGCLNGERAVAFTETATDFASEGITGTVSFNFAPSATADTPAQGYLLFAESAGRAASARAEILKRVERVGKRKVSASLLTLDNNVLVFWAAKPENDSQRAFVSDCLAQSSE